MLCNALVCDNQYVLYDNQYNIVFDTIVVYNWILVQIGKSNYIFIVHYTILQLQYIILYYSYSTLYYTIIIVHYTILQLQYTILYYSTLLYQYIIVHNIKTYVSYGDTMILDNVFYTWHGKVIRRNTKTCDIIVATQYLVEVS